MVPGSSSLVRSWSLVLWSCGFLISAAAAVHGASDADAQLIAAVKRGQPAIARQLLLQQHADANAREADGTTALHWAVRGDDLETTQLLIRAGANAGASNRYGVTPIALAATNGNAELPKPQKATRPAKSNMDDEIPF